MSEQKKKENTKTTNKSTKKTTPGVSTEKAGSQSVRGKVALYQKTAAQFNLAAAEMVQSGILALQAGMRDMQSAIGKQKKKNAEGAVAIQSGVDEMVSNIAAMRVAIAEHAQDNQDYIKQFIG
jgi:hypothetical protein